MEEAKKLPDTLAMNLIVGEIIASLHKTVINGKDKEKAAELVRIVIPEWLRCLADDNTHLAVFFSHLIGDLFQNGLKDLTSARIFSEVFYFLLYILTFFPLVECEKHDVLQRKSFGCIKANTRHRAHSGP